MRKAITVWVPVSGNGLHTVSKMGNHGPFTVSCSADDTVVSYTLRREAFDAIGETQGSMRRVITVWFSESDNGRYTVTRAGSDRQSPVPFTVSCAGDGTVYQCEIRGEAFRFVGAAQKKTLQSLLAISENA